MLEKLKPQKTKKASDFMTSDIQQENPDYMVYCRELDNIADKLKKPAKRLIKS